MSHPPHAPTVDGSEAGEWYACEHPERPHEPDWTAYWSECAACRLALVAAAVNVPSMLYSGLDLRTPDDLEGREAYTGAEALAKVLDKG